MTMRQESHDQPSYRLKNGLRLHLRRDFLIVFSTGQPRKRSLRERFIEWLAAVLIRDPDVAFVAAVLEWHPTVTCVGAVQPVRLPDGGGGLVFVTSQGEADQATQGEIVDLFYNTFIKDKGAEHDQPQTGSTH